MQTGFTDLFIHISVSFPSVSFLVTFIRLSPFEICSNCGVGCGVGYRCSSALVQCGFHSSAERVITLLSFIIISRMHHYDCVVPDISLQSGRF